MKMFTKVPLAAVTIAIAASSVNTASAEGFLAGLARDIGIIDENQRRALDDWHAANGSPLDRVPGAALSMVNPGLGAAYEANQQFIQMKDQWEQNYATGSFPPAVNPGHYSVPMLPGGAPLPVLKGNTFGGVNSIATMPHPDVQTIWMGN